MAEARTRLRAIVIGVSAGGVRALRRLLGKLPADFPLPILVVQHISPDAGNGMSKLMADYCLMQVKEADEGDRIVAGTIYLAPPNYHLLVEMDETLALSADRPVSYARPSIDVLFESAAELYGPGLIGVILTGANHDGAHGARMIKERGGILIVQDPADAESPQMPKAALAATTPDHVMALAGMTTLLKRLVEDDRARQRLKELSDV